MAKLLPVSLFLLWPVTPAIAASVNAASCSDANVQTAINSASVGDTVAVPAGNCTWTGTVAISGKRITLQGAGIGQTNITDQGSGGAALKINASAANLVTVTGFTFVKSSNHANGIIQVGGPPEAAFRIHHIRILHSSGGARGIVVETVYGLIDHVAFDVTTAGSSVQNVSVWGSSAGSDGGFTPWNRPLELGTNKAVYVEDCVFTYVSQEEDSIDSYSGGRLVIRYNQFNSITIGFHGTDSGDQRSVFSYEIYGNTFTNNSATTIRGATLRGGTGVIYNNTYTGSHGAWYSFILMIYRACPPLSSSWGPCDGTNWQIGSTNFSAQASRTTSTTGGVKFCSSARDTVCTSDATCAAVNGGTCSTYFDGSATAGYACRDQPGRTHDQVLAPIYAWNNGSVHFGTYDGGFSCGVGLNNYIQPGRDYIDGVPMPGYSAYVYPHPFQGQSAAPAPASNLTVSVR